jgi:hypothetical protein
MPDDPKRKIYGYPLPKALRAEPKPAEHGVGVGHGIARPEKKAVPSRCPIRGDPRYPCGFRNFH